MLTMRFQVRGDGTPTTLPILAGALQTFYDYRSTGYRM
jgi:hypothetical protein